MPLHVDYRPRSLDEVEGNTSTVRALKAYLKRDADERNHSLLFTGPSGCGKTTLARIVAAALGAYKVGGKASDFPDYTELNAADFRGVEMARNLRRQMQFKPVKSSCRVWLLDECHKLTGDAQEALLKCLEEPPPHVYFLLATTDPDKLRTTLRRRCTPFEVGPLTDDELLALLKEIVSNEKAKTSKQVVQQIIQDSLGSPGMALMILDKVIDLPLDEQKEAAAAAAERQNAAIELCRALMQDRRSWKAVSAILRGLKGEDVESLRRAVLGYASSVLVNKNNSQAFVVLDSFFEPFYDTGFPGLVHAAYTATVAS